MKTNSRTSTQTPFIFLSKRGRLIPHFSDIKNHQKTSFYKILLISMLSEKKHNLIQLKYALSAYYQNFRLKLIAFAIGKVCFLSDIRLSKNVLFYKTLAHLSMGEKSSKVGFFNRKGWQSITL
jgi:hypothetical protein